MNSASPSQADQLVSGLDARDFARLLESAGAPDEEFGCVSLVDLPGSQAHSIGDQDCSPAAGVARALFHHGEPAEPGLLDGAKLRIGLRAAGHVLLLFKHPTPGAVAVASANRLDSTRLRQVAVSVARSIGQGDIQAAVEALPGISRGWLVDAKTAAVTKTHSRQGSAFQPRTKVLDTLDFETLVAPLVAAIAGKPMQGPVPRDWLDAAVIDDGHTLREYLRVPFVPRLLVVQAKPASAPVHRLWNATESLANDVLREVIGLILASGFDTRIHPFPETDVEFDRLINELRTLASTDLDQRLNIGGFADHPIDGPDGAMRCKECIYYLPHRRWCDLPELPVPVAAQWFCRLWKI